MDASKQAVRDGSRSIDWAWIEEMAARQREHDAEMDALWEARWKDVPPAEWPPHPDRWE